MSEILVRGLGVGGGERERGGRGSGRGIGSYFDENIHHCVLCKIKYSQVYSFDLAPLKMLFLTKITIWD